MTNIILALAVGFCIGVITAYVIELRSNYGLSRESRVGELVFKDGAINERTAKS